MAARRVGSVPWRGDVFCGVGGTARGLVVAPLRRTHEWSGWVAPSARGRTGRVPALGHACGGHVGPVWPYLCRYQHRSHKMRAVGKDVGKKFGAVGLQNSIRAVRRPILAAWTLKHQTRNRLQALPQRSIRLRSAPSSSYRQARLRPPSTAARLETTPAHRRLDSASPPPSSVVAASDLGSPQCAWSFSAADAVALPTGGPLFDCMKRHIRSTS
jgi:hypothetical protein